MSAVQAFNNMLSMFLGELELAFPDEKSIVGVRAAFALACKGNARLPLDTFMDAMTPHVLSIMNKDPTFFAEAAATIPYVKDIHIQDHWASAPAATKDAIWEYLSTLTMLGMGVRNIPPDVLRQAESLALSLAEKIEKGEGSASQLLEDVITGVKGITAPDMLLTEN